MWLLEADGDLLGGKRVWLRPGTRHMFGRTKPGTESSPTERTHWVDSKKVSRKHITISIAEVPAQDRTKLHAKSKLEVSDSSKYGTSIDGGERFMTETRTLSAMEHTIRLGSWEQSLKIIWRPVVFTFTTKEKKSAKARTHQLQALDIKTAADFLYGKTTHVVSLKRNLPKCLQALVTGIPIVTNSYVDAVLGATSLPQNHGSGEAQWSSLELDFDAYWPNEAEHIPPPGQEPVPRPSPKLKPDSSRSEVFSGLTFVFLEEGQYASLHPPISGGGGKALLFGVKPGETTAAEYVQYVRSAANEKRRPRAGQGDVLPIITVRLSSYPDGMEEWAANFVSAVDRALNQRSILQNEFLDAIIMNDASSLRKKPLDVQWSSSPSHANQEATRQSSHDVPDQPGNDSMSTTQMEDQRPSKSPLDRANPINKRAPRRLVTTSRFTGFDDYNPPSNGLSKGNQILPARDNSKQLSLTSTDPPPHSAPVAQAGRKRSAPVSEDEAGMEQMDELLPAAAAIKRRRLEAQGSSESPMPETERSPRMAKSKAAGMLDRLHQAKNKMAEKDIDVREHARQRLEAEEKARRCDEESLRQGLQGIDISTVRGLGDVEEVEVHVRPARTSTTEDERHSRWDDAWNGRKNFKRFRRRGIQRGPQLQKVLVPLEEVPQTASFDLGNEFLLDQQSISRGRKTKPSSFSNAGSQQQQNQHQRLGPLSACSKAVEAEESDSEPGPGLPARRRTSKVGTPGQTDQRATEANLLAAATTAAILVEDSAPEEGADAGEVLQQDIAANAGSASVSERVDETQQSHAASRVRAPSDAHSETLPAGTGSTTSVTAHTRSRKRPVPSSAASSTTLVGPPAKRQRGVAGAGTRSRRAVAVAQNDEDSDEMETGFRFRKRGKRT